MKKPRKRKSPAPVAIRPGIKPGTAAMKAQKRRVMAMLIKEFGSTSNRK